MSLSIAIVVLWVVVLCLGITVFALARQIGILYERIAPMGALMLDDGPKVGEQSPSFDLATLDGGRIKIGATSTHGELVFFLSPTCPVCKKLIPILRSMREKQKKFYETTKLQDFPYVLSNDLGMAFKVAKLPYAVLIDEAGIVRSKGLINNREQLESLLTAKELAVESIQQYLHTS